MTLPRTPMTDLLGIEFPLIQAAMSWASSGAALPGAVSAAGGLGVIAAGPMRPDDLRATIAEVRAMTAAPFAVNVPLYGKYRDQHLDVVEDERVPIFVGTQGGTSRYADRLRAAGTVLLHVVSSVEHARKAMRDRVDGLVVVGGEAGGHPPSHGVSTAVLTRAVLAADLGVPVATSGAVADGYGVAAMLALGADAVQLGTRFAATTEARLHADYKAMLLAADLESTRTIGPPQRVARVLPNSFTVAYDAELGRGDVEGAEELFHATTLRIAAFEGDVERGKVEAGQTVGLIDDVPPVDELVARIVREYDQAVGRLAMLTDREPHDALEAL